MNESMIEVTNMRVLLWIIVVVLVLFPVGYFVWHWSDSSFRDGAIGNWFGTVVGVVVGIPVGMAVVRAQQKSHAESEQQRELAIRKEYLRSIRNRVFDELQYNSGLVTYLAEVLSKSPTARSDLWRWASQIVTAIEIEDYRELDAMLLPEERGLYGGVMLAYGDLRRLVSRIQESAAVHDFLLGYSANEGEANFRLGEAKAHAGIVQSEISSAIKNIQSLA
jgi:hypothetical protein